MFKKAMLLTVALSIFLAGNVQAFGFTSGGWGYCFGCGSIVGTFELRGTGKTSDGDSVSITITPTNVEYVCKNPGGEEGHFVFGTPGFQVTGAEDIDGGNAIQKNGKVTVTVDIDIENDLVLIDGLPIKEVGTSKPNMSEEEVDCPQGFCVTFYDTLECVNPNWTVLRGSVVPRDMDALAIWFDGDLTEKDRVDAICELDPVLRHGKNTTIDGVDVSFLPFEPQHYDCVDITGLDLL